jgi:hypothetical protein
MKKFLFLLKDLSIALILAAITIYLKAYQNLYLEGVTDKTYKFLLYNPQYPVETISINILVIISTITCLYRALILTKYMEPFPSRN